MMMDPEGRDKIADYFVLTAKILVVIAGVVMLSHCTSCGKWVTETESTWKSH